MSEEKNNKTSCLMKLFIWAFLLCLVVCLIVVADGGWAYYKLTKTNDLAIYLSNKLSKPNRYKINIESFKNTLPIITANNFSYNKISDISSLSVNIKGNIFLGLKNNKNSCLLYEYDFSKENEEINFQCIGKGIDICSKIVLH